MFQLGPDPETFTVTLPRDADFVTGLDSEDGDWPVTASIQLRFDDGTTWAAAIVGAAADWNVDKAEVDALIAGGPSSVRLDYNDGSSDLLWGIGRVAVVG